jgi:hypothetical protein
VGWFRAIADPLDSGAQNWQSGIGSEEILADLALTTALALNRYWFSSVVRMAGESWVRIMTVT